MQIERLRLGDLRIPFRTSFRHAAAERSETSSLWVEAASGGLTGYGESCPRPYVTGESQETARAFFDEHVSSLRNEVTGLDSLRDWTRAHAAAIDTNPAAWCAVELALLDLMARGAGQTIEAFLSLPALLGPFRYTAVLGDQGEASFAAMAQGYRRMGFTDFKVKLSGELERDRQKLAVLGGLGLPALRVRVDANNLWPEAEPAIAHLRHLGPLFGVEEPIRPGRYEELARVAASLGCRVILDESFVSAVQFDLLEPFAGRFVINVRVSKMGGLIRSLAVVSGAHERGIPLIVGAQVGETSVLTRAGLTVAQAAFADLVAQEGAFGTFLLERDACEPSLMFGAGGVLDPQAYPALGTPGFGLHQVGHDVRRWSG